MSPQTDTKASVGFKAGVKDYKLTYYTPEYETKILISWQHSEYLLNLEFHPKKQGLQYLPNIVNRGTHSTTTMNFPSILVPLVGLVFPAIAMASLFLHVQKNKIV